MRVPDSQPRNETIAAGAVVLRPRLGDDPHVLLVHRPAYDDWSLPKGKPNPNEYLPATAVREVFEETAVSIRLDVPVNRIQYPVGGGIKTVSYWRAHVVSARRRKPDREVDRTAWLTPRNALARLSYDDEKALLNQALELPPTSPLLIVRHGKATARKLWKGSDTSRPLDPVGLRQSKDLVALLHSYGVVDLASSIATRCMSTLAPYGKELHLNVGGWSALTEEEGQHNPAAVTKLMRRLAGGSIATGRRLAVCGHRPVLPAMLEALGVPGHPMQPGEAAVVHLTIEGVPAAVEWYPPLR